MKKVSGHKPGGGIASRMKVEKPQRLGAAAKGTNPRMVSQIGSAMGNHITSRGKTVNKAVEKMHARPAPTNAGQPLGNAVAEATRAGPGGSRTVDKCGSQGCF